MCTYVIGSTKTTTKLGWQGQSSHSSIERGRKNCHCLCVSAWYFSLLWKYTCTPERGATFFRSCKKIVLTVPFFKLSWWTSYMNVLSKKKGTSSLKNHSGRNNAIFSIGREWAVAHWLFRIKQHLSTASLASTETLPWQTEAILPLPVLQASTAARLRAPPQISRKKG